MPRFLGKDQKDWSEKWGWDSEFDWRDYSNSGGSSSSSGSQGGGTKNGLSIAKRFMNSDSDGGGLLSKVWNGGGFEEGSYAGVPSDPSGYNIDSGGGGLSDWFSSLFGGEGAAGGGAEGGSSAWSIAGWVAVIVGAALGQNAAADNNDREFEGVDSGGAFTGQFGTEPWYAKLGDQWGYEVSPGEKFDAAVKNSDQELALRRFPAMANYWADPFANYIGDAMKDQWGDNAEGLFNPVGLISGWFD